MNAAIPFPIGVPLKPPDRQLLSGAISTTMIIFPDSYYRLDGW
jgi:hypothetical protein